jgi:hypothetical protein
MILNTQLGPTLGSIDTLSIFSIKVPPQMPKNSMTSQPPLAPTPNATISACTIMGYQTDLKQGN